MTPDPRSRYNLAVEVARRAGDSALAYYESAFEVEHKPDASPVTIADRNAERIIRDRITAGFPDDAVMGEEFGFKPGTSGFRWVLDPIDGTKSFIRHVPIWGTLIGLEFNGEQIGGVAYAPVFGQLYRALRGDGAYRNDRRIRVSDVATLGEASFCYSSVAWFARAGREKTYLELASKTQRQRGYGDFYGFVLVAEGAVDIMVEHGVHEWDVSAVKAIVEEAGGTFTDWDGTPTTARPDVLATNGRLHAETLSILQGGSRNG